MSKKIFLFIAILLMGGLAVSGLVLAGGTDQLGQGGYPSDPHRIYRIVHNATASTIPSGSLVIWDLDMDNGVSVTTTEISGDSAVAGITVGNYIPAQTTATNTAALDIGRSNWGLVQTYGLNSLATNDGTYLAVAGDSLGASATAGRICAFTVDFTDRNRRKQGIAGFFYDNTAVGTTSVDCLLTID